MRGDHAVVAISNGTLVLRILHWSQFEQKFTLPVGSISYMDLASLNNLYIC